MQPDSVQPAPGKQGSGRVGSFVGDRHQHPGVRPERGQGHKGEAGGSNQDNQSGRRRRLNGAGTPPDLAEQLHAPSMAGPPKHLANAALQPRSTVSSLSRAARVQPQPSSTVPARRVRRLRTIRAITTAPTETIAAKRTELSYVPTATATNAQQAAKTKPATAVRRSTMMTAATVATATRMRLTAVTKVPASGRPRERNMVPKPAADASTTQPR